LTKKIHERSSQKNEKNSDICQNSWKLNSQLVKSCLLSQPLGYYYKLKIEGVFCIISLQLLKIWDWNYWSLFFKMNTNLPKSANY
jgi:hypothetical protein